MSTKSSLQTEGMATKRITKKKTNPPVEPQSIVYPIGLGSTAIGIGVVLGRQMLSFEHLTKIKNVGDKVKDKDLDKTQPKTLILFSDQEAIKHLIKQLKKLLDDTRKKGKARNE